MSDRGFTPSQFARYVEEAVDGFQVGQFISIGHLSMVTGLPIPCLTAGLTLSIGEGSNWRLSYQGLKKGLIRTR